MQRPLFVENSPVDKLGLWKRVYALRLSILGFCFIFLAATWNGCKVRERTGWRFQVPYSQHSNLPFAYVHATWNWNEDGTPHEPHNTAKTYSHPARALRVALYLPSCLPLNLGDSVMIYNLGLKWTQPEHLKRRGLAWIPDGISMLDVKFQVFKDGTTVELVESTDNSGAAERFNGFSGLEVLHSEWITWTVTIPDSFLSKNWYLLLEDLNRSGQRWIMKYSVETATLLWDLDKDPVPFFPFHSSWDVVHTLSDQEPDRSVGAWEYVLLPQDSLIPAPPHGVLGDQWDTAWWNKEPVYGSLPPNSTVWIPQNGSGPPALFYTGWDEKGPEPGVDDLRRSLRYLTRKQEYVAMEASHSPWQEVEAFWADKPQAQSEWELRLATANLFFTDYRPGYLTDRGMIFLVFGPPDLVHQSHPDAEVWSYDFSWIQQTLEFTFTEFSRQGLPWTRHLLRSPAFEPVWMQQVRHWRNGSIDISEK